MFAAFFNGWRFFLSAGKQKLWLLSKVLQLSQQLWVNSNLTWGSSQECGSGKRTLYVGSTNMPSGSSKNKKGGGTDLTSTTKVCALCCDTLKKGQDVLKCEGSCGCNVHRYCAGVTKLYFDELVKGSIPFVC